MATTTDEQVAQAAEKHFFSITLMAHDRRDLGPAYERIDKLFPFGEDISVVRPVVISAVNKERCAMSALDMIEQALDDDSMDTFDKIEVIRDILSGEQNDAAPPAQQISVEEPEQATA